MVSERIRYSLGTQMPRFKKILSLKLPLALVVPLLVVVFFFGTVTAKLNLGVNTLTVAIRQNQNIDSLKISVNEAQFTNNIRVSEKSVPAPDGKNFLLIFKY